MAHSDSMFFTNEPGKELHERFKKLIKGFQFFDILVGYFRASGFYMLCDELQSVDKIRVLVGIDTDGVTKAAALASRGCEQRILPFSNEKASQNLMKESIEEMAQSDDTLSIESGVRKFIDFLCCPCLNEKADKEAGNNGRKMEIRVYPNAKLHAKVYIGKFPEDYPDYGRVITGSSNFSYNGLRGQHEFNVELKERSDYEFAHEQFERLWEESTDVTEDYVSTLMDKTWLDDSITPYELYLKMLYEYFKEELSDVDDDRDSYLPEDFMELGFQKQAVASAIKILSAYGGVFLADVVGLGKTFMAALLAQRVPGRHLVICPPTLKAYWEDTFREFRIGRFDVESIGKLDDVIRNIGMGRDYACVFVDEAHRFRNEYTQGFESLHQICAGRRVVLVSATPLNNSLDDIFNLLKLFQKPRNSTIPGVPDLEAFFGNIRKRLTVLEKGTPEYAAELQSVSRDTRDKILRYVMVRRTRSEITRFYSDDITKQGLKFPIVAPPHRIIYHQDEVISTAFNDTIAAIKEFKYARFAPLRYVKPSEGKVIEGLNQKLQHQSNVGGFMKMILVKRLESSIYAFRLSIARFIISYEKFIAMFERGKVLIGQKSDIYSLLEEDDETISAAVEAEGGEEYNANIFRSEFSTALRNDLAVLRMIQSVWEGIEQDPKLDAFITELKNNPNLINGQAIIFTESKETGKYIQRKMDETFPGKSLFYCATESFSGRQSYNKQQAKYYIHDNFDPKGQDHNLRFLVTTDVLSEGINLHQAGNVINYDLPWNPTRVLQRVGRVNRIGSAHSAVHIYNFFPTDEQEKQIGLESTVKRKIQAFHDALGEDAKYLTDEEVIDTYTLFGNALYNKLNEAGTYSGESEESSELEYLQIIQEIKRDNPELFTRIASIPAKARSGRCLGDSTLLITFFRQGLLKKFIACNEGNQKELPFLDAVRYFECDKNEKRVFPELEPFYDRLSQNKEYFYSLLSDTVSQSVRKNKGGASTRWLIGYVSAIMPRVGENADDKDFLSALRNAVSSGLLPARRLNNLKKKLEKTLNPHIAIDILRNEVPGEYLEYGHERTVAHITDKREIILSEWVQA